MRHQHRLVGAAVTAATFATVAFGSAVWSEEHKHAEEHQHSVAASQEGSSLSMSRFYGGLGARTGEFPGKLVCLRCDIKPGPGAMAQCEKEGHRHALSMESDGMVHPLLAGTDEVLKQINSGALHGKDVMVHGKYYPSTGAILVDHISTGK